MGLIGWIKKEIESTSRQRRQSAPPPINHNLTYQDPAYRRAIEKFREYRSSGRFERLNETKNTSVITQSDVTANNKTIDEIYITDVEIQSHEKERLKSYRNQNDHKTAIYSNCNPEEVVNRNKRLSLPIIADKMDPSSNGERRKAKKIQPTSTIDEIEEFEQNHCKQLDDVSFENCITTPPVKFYRKNSDPYDEAAKNIITDGSLIKKSSDTSKKQTPKRVMGKSMLRRSNKGKAPQPPQRTNSSNKNAKMAGEVSESPGEYYNGNFKRYDVSTASDFDDEFVISSRAYKGKMRKEHPENINSVGESSGSLSSDNTNDKNNHRQSLLNYQTVINKHGEEVEYALPYNERDSTLHLPPPLPDAPIPTNDHHQISSQFEQLIDQNFKFLNSKMDFLNSQIDAGDDALKVFDSIDLQQRQNLQVTDLDKSNENGLAFPMQTGDIMKDLDALSKWTQNFEKNDIRRHSPIHEYQATQKGVKVFNACDIKYKPGSLRNSFSTPLEFSNGYFHQTPITMRSTLPNNYNISNFADVGCKREFEILSQIKHLSIATLMGICFDKDLRVTSLIMEPFDYTLNHYLHQMDKFYNIQQTVSIIHQIASATQYLNECGFIHSNISSHAVLIRENPFAVKLSSFELATEISQRDVIGNIYEMQKIKAAVTDNFCHDNTGDHLTCEKYGKLSKQHFYNRTSLPIVKFDDDIDDDGSKLPYSIAYRRMFSMHYYQAPELLVPTNNSSVKYVMPTIRSDVYGLALMLWELINRVVPYVIYNHDELICGLIKGKVQLPVLDKSSIIFKEVFENCLHVDSNNRLSSVSKFIKMLEDLQLFGYEKDKIEVLEIIEPYHEHNKKEKNIKNSDQRDKLREKIYFSKTEMDPVKRFENALTSENLADLGIRDVSKISESIHSAEMEPQMMMSFNQPGILQDDALDRIRKTVESQRDITPKKPCRKKDDEHFEMSKNSTMFQSFFGFDRLQTPKVDKDVIYERTSTLKKRMKTSGSERQKKSVKGLFDDKVVTFEDKPDNLNVVDSNFDIKSYNIDEKKILQQEFEKMNEELNLIISNYNKNDFMQEIVQEMKHREKAKKDSDMLVSSFLNKGIQDNKLSRSFEELPVNDKEDEFHGINSIDVSGSNLNRFSSHESFSLPHTPIARQNMIRRNAWLSENNRQPSNTHISDEIVKRSLNFSKNSPLNETSKSSNSKQYNVNIKIHHNDLDSHHMTPKSTNLNQSNSSVKIKLYNSSSKLSPIVKINNVDLNKTSYTEDINKKYYPLMPEMLSDAIQNKRDRSCILGTSLFEDERKNFKRLDEKIERFEAISNHNFQPCTSQMTQFEDERNRINNEKKLQALEHSVNLLNHNDNLNEEKVVAPLPMSVRDTVKFIETTFNPKTDKLLSANHHNNDDAKCQKICEETQTEECDFPMTIKNEEAIDEGTECLMQASESIQKLENLQSKVADIPKKKILENLANQSTTATQTPKKITTKVTLNLKKISGRSSDVTHLKCIQEQSQNSEIIKRFQVHFKGKESSLAKNEQISASCSSLVSKDCHDEMIPSAAGHKYFCRNCGFTMIPTEILQKLQKSGRLSIASSIAENLQSIKYDDGLQSLAAIKKCQQLAETRSTEDLYIDDDFCQGISHSLAANMELLPPPDFFDSIDFNILSAEIFHTQEHEIFDDTLTGCDTKLKQIEECNNDGDDKNAINYNEEINVSQKEQKHDDEVPICDENNEEIKKQDVDEPKV